MHELSIIYPIIQMSDRIARENKVEHITAVRLLVGELHDMNEKWVDQYFQRFSKGTTLEGSHLEIRRVPILFKCKLCGAEQSYTYFSFVGVDLKCNSCSAEAENLEMLSGREIQIEEIEFIDPEKNNDPAQERFWKEGTDL